MSRRKRLAPPQRREQLVEVAARLLSAHGADKVQITEVADAAGVTRPVVYRFFENRPALLIAVLEDFEAALGTRFRESAVAGSTGPLEAVTRLFVDAVCETIEHKGAGAWHLLDAKGPDPEVASAAAAIQRRLLGPWEPRITELTGGDATETAVVSRMVVAAGRAALDLWLDGTIPREHAAAHAARAVTAILGAFLRARR